ncbi:hypothetical protein M3194_20970 [Paenibacillus glycanilyticus]|uniref:hypothetical protein n=1 Tax=Paenibacillus glycanilyticus TaxID=126569 RepID=UPI00203E4A04|nr:hypothetical protein [Paenibacillus glycanilyticus]MCM3629810.1 hypothetical protein [Paenibacillus glycanilyticus]
MRAGAVCGAGAFARRKIIQIDGDVVHSVILDARVHMHAVIAERQFLDPSLFIVLKPPYDCQFVKARGDTLQQQPPRSVIQHVVQFHNPFTPGYIVMYS